MVTPSKTLGLENLETRLNLSSTAALFAPSSPVWQSSVTDQFIQNGRLRLMSLSLQPNTTPGNSTTSLVTNTQDNSSGALAAPDSLQATVTSVGVRITWIDRAPNETGYRVLRSTDGVNYSTIATLERNSMGVLDTTVQAGTTYYYEVQAYNKHNVSSSLGPVSVTTPLAAATQIAATAPDAPGTPNVTTTSNSVSLAWADLSNNEQGFTVARSTDGVNFTNVADLGVNATTWTDLTVSSNTQYWYTVSAWNADGSNSSSVVSALTQPSTPVASTNLAASTTTNSVALTWTDNAANAQGVKVYRSTDGTNFSVVATLSANTSNWTDTSVSASTTYWYKVGDYNAGGETDTSAVSATTLTPAPALTTNLSAVTTTNSVALTWTDNANNEQGYKVYRSTDGTTFTVVAMLTANTSNWTDTSVSAGTTYWYKVGDYNAGGETDTSAISATTQTPAPAVAANLAASTTTNSVALTWTDNATNEQGYKVYRSTNGTTFTVVATLAANTSNWTDTSVSAGTTYWYKVGDYNAGGETDTSAISATTQTPAPAAAANLAATTTTNSVALTWTDNANNEQGYKVYRSTDGTNFTVVATLAANSGSWTDTSVSASTTYWYKIGDYNAGGETDTSSISATTQTPVVAMATNLAASTTTNSVALTWTDNGTNEQGVKIYRSTDGTNFSIVATLSANTASWTDTSVSASTTYWYKVGDYNAGGETDTSAISATTQTPAPAVATNLSASTTTSSVALTWTDNGTNEQGYKVYRSTNGTTFTVVATLAANTSSWTDTSVSASTTYWYKVGDYNAGGETDTSAISATTQTPAPAVAANLAATTTTNSVALTWTDNANNEQGNKVYRSTNGTTFTVVATLAANTSSWTDTSVSASTTYWYKVGDYNAGGETDTSAISATTQTPAPAVATNLAASTTTSSVALTWTDNGTNEQGYKVYRSTNGTTFTVVATLAANTSSWTDTSVSASTTYWYKVGDYNAGGETDTSSISATTQTPAPAVATNLSASTTTSSVALTWTDNGTNEQGYKVYRSTNGTTFTVVATLAANTSSWTDTSVSASTTYWYKVGDYNAGGETDTSSISATTQTPAPAVATNLSASTTTSSVALTWTDNGTNEQGYKVYRSTNGTTFTVVATLAANTSSWTDTSVSASTTYWYKVGDYNAGGETDTAAITASTPAPAPPPSSGGVTFATANMTSFTELVINGTSSNDSIYVSQSNGVLTVTANSQVTTYNATFGDIKIYGEGGNDSITVDSSVNIATLIYGGNGNDTIKALGSAKMTIVTLGSGTNTVTGNGINTSYWVNPNDIVNASAAEIALGGVNRVSGFYQPFTTSTSSSNYIPTTLLGQNLPDPTDSGTVIRLQNSSFWGTGPSMNDINQGGIADCYYLAGLSSMADTMPQKLMNMGVDLGDGTFAVRYVRNGVTTYVRVDGDLSAGYGSHGLADNNPGADGNQWASIFEKAYAFYRSGANTYASLNYGSASAALRDAGLNATAISTSGISQTSLQSLINSELAQGKAIVANTNGSITSGAPLAGSHSYTVIGCYLNSSGQLMIQLRNPWGVDGFNDGSNPSDGIVTISYSQLTSNIGSISYMT